MTTVAVTYLHRSDVGHNFMESMLELRGSDTVTLTERVPILCGAGSLVESRNQSARVFLDSGSEWLLNVDSDMGFAADTVIRLVESADPVERPIMGALCWAQGSVERDGLNGYSFRQRPTIMAMNHEPGGKAFGFVGSFEYDQVIECDATGAACLLVHRTVFEKIEAEYGPVWWDRMELNDTIAGEDVSFCLRAKSLGFPTHVNTGVPTNHLKPCYLSGGQP